MSWPFEMAGDFIFIADRFLLLLAATGSGGG